MPSTFFGWVGFLAREYGGLFLRGTGVTLLIAITGTLLGFLLGLLVAIARTIELSPHAGVVKRALVKLLHAALGIYIEVFRGTPMIVQAMVIYYGALQYLNIDMPRLVAAIFIVSINTGAYMAEIVRGGIISIDRGQFEGAMSIGMNHFQTMLRVVIPQVMRNILPSVSNEFVINIKDTSVLNVIGVTELYYFAGIIKRQNFQTFQTYLVICVLYFILTFAVTRLLRWLEKKLDGKSNYIIFGSQSDLQAEIRISQEEGRTSL